MDLGQARKAVELIEAEQAFGAQRAERRGFLGEEPSSNLVYGLAAVIREGIGGSPDEEFAGGEARIAWEVPKVRGAERFAESPTGGIDGISIDAIGATVAAAFAGADIAPRDDAAEVIHGAVLLALSLADEEADAWMKESEPAAEIPIKAPWEVSRPVLLDPVMWMVLAAYQRS